MYTWFSEIGWACDTAVQYHKIHVIIMSVIICALGICEVWL